MTTTSYVDFHRQLIANLQEYVCKQAPFTGQELPEEDAQFLSLLAELTQNPLASRDGQHLGQQLINTIIARYPQITPMVPRDLFWFFGGDCLHFLGDEEVEVFQQLDEEYHVLLEENPDGADYGGLRGNVSAKLRAALANQQPGHLN